ncbi:AMP-binding protein [Paraburkholderia fungorum]|uniref:AMP-binding protein n=2 Tax=Paraburkholderia fungorum TaxID=134537 RepID=UPI0036F2B393
MRVFLPNDMTGSFYLSRLSRDAVWPCINEDQICGRSYTSGTTGDTKGVCYSNRSTVLHAFAAALPDSFGLPARDCVMPVVPMFHVNAWGGRRMQRRWSARSLCCLRRLLRRHETRMRCAQTDTQIIAQCQLRAVWFCQVSAAALNVSSSTAWSDC